MRAPRSAALGAVASLVFLATLSGGPPRAEATPPVVANLRPAAAVTWPPSTGLLLAEVVTGGASASDEYVEITNAGPVPVDLAGMELVYVTSSGSTVTRKAAWGQLELLDTGRHLLVANSLGVFASGADATYSGGFAATGGALVLRAVGGAPVDAVGWGDATNSYVEGAAAPAPPAGQSIERQPGGTAGNITDTNQNAVDWVVLAAPVPQNLASPQAPEPSSPPSPTPTPMPTPSPDPSPTPTPAPTPTLTPLPSPDPSPTPTPTPSLSPTPIETVSVAAARASADGATVTVEGVLTAPLGLLDAGRAGFLQDGTAGIALYAASAVDAMPAGSLVRLAGVVDDRYGERTIRLSGSPTPLATGPVPVAADSATGAAAEPLEGLRIRVQGTVVDTPTVLSDGPAVTLDDGSGALRVVFAGNAAGLVPARGSLVSVAGPLGQRDSSGSGAGGYRLFVVDPSDVVLGIAPSPSPSPTEVPGASPSPDPSADPSPTPTPGPSLSPAPSPSPGGDPVTIASVRGTAIGTTVHVRGVVTAEPGRVGLPVLGVVADESGAVFVRFPAGVAPARGALLDVVGRLADPYGQLEIRPGSAGVQLIGQAPLPDSLPIGAASLGELVEARLASLDATLDAAIIRESGGDLVLRLVDATGAAFRARATRASGLETGLAQRGDRVHLVGIVGQRASARGQLDGYRLWLRDAGDVSRLPAVAPSPTPTVRPKPGASSPAVVTVADALRLGSGNVTVEGVVTIATTLLDSTGRRSVIQDTTAAVEILVPRDASAPRPGDRVRVIGTLGRAYGAPRITAGALTVLGHVAEPAPIVLAGTPSSALEWRLVVIEGVVSDQRRLGDRWRAEIGAPGGPVPVAGLPGAGIPATALVEGNRVRVVGILRRPNPAAADQRFVIVPRSAADIRIIARSTAPGGVSSSGTTAARPGASVSSTALGGGGAGGGTVTPVSADVADLARFAGRVVRVGGLAAAVDTTGLVLNDGTGSARLDLVGDARSLLPLIGPGDAIGAAGLVLAGTPPTIRVTDPAALVRLGDLGEALPIAGSDPSEDGEVTVQEGRPAPDSKLPTATPGLDLRGTAGGAALAPTTAGAGSLGALVAAGGTFVMVRRRRDRRITRARIARRLAELGVPAAPDLAPPGAQSRAVAGPPGDCVLKSADFVRESA